MVNIDICHDLDKANAHAAWLFLQTQLSPCVIFSASHKLQCVPWGSEETTSEYYTTATLLICPPIGLNKTRFHPKTESLTCFA